MEIRSLKGVSRRPRNELAGLPLTPSFGPETRNDQPEQLTSGVDNSGVLKGTASWNHTSPLPNGRSPQRNANGQIKAGLHADVLGWTSPSSPVQRHGEEDTHGHGVNTSPMGSFGFGSPAARGGLQRKTGSGLGHIGKTSPSAARRSSLGDYLQQTNQGIGRKQPRTRSAQTTSQTVGQSNAKKNRIKSAGSFPNTTNSRSPNTNLAPIRKGRTTSPKRQSTGASPGKGALNQHVEYTDPHGILGSPGTSSSHLPQRLGAPRDIAQISPSGKTAMTKSVISTTPNPTRVSPSKKNKKGRGTGNSSSPATAASALNKALAYGNANGDAPHSPFDRPLVVDDVISTVDPNVQDLQQAMLMQCSLIANQLARIEATAQTGPLNVSGQVSSATGDNVAVSQLVADITLGLRECQEQVAHMRGLATNLASSGTAHATPSYPMHALDDESNGGGDDDNPALLKSGGSDPLPGIALTRESLSSIPALEDHTSSLRSLNGNTTVKSDTQLVTPVPENPTAEPVVATRSHNEIADPDQEVKTVTESASASVSGSPVTRRHGKAPTSLTNLNKLSGSDLMRAVSGGSITNDSLDGGDESDAAKPIGLAERKRGALGDGTLNASAPATTSAKPPAGPGQKAAPSPAMRTSSSPARPEEPRGDAASPLPSLALSPMGAIDDDDQQATLAHVQKLIEISKSLASELDLDKLMKKIMTDVMYLVGADRCSLFLADWDKEQLWTKISTGLGMMKEIRIPITAGLAGHVASTGNTLNIPDAYEDSRFNQAIDKKTGYRTRSVLCVPLNNSKGTIIGVAQVINKISSKDPSKHIPFSNMDIEFLSALGAQAAVAIDNSLLFEKHLENKLYLDSILESINNLVITLNLEGHLVTTNRDTLDAIGIDEEDMKSQHYSEWLGEKNKAIISSLDAVFSGASQSISVPDQQLTTNKDYHINYTVLPLMVTRDKQKTQNGVVVIVEDQSDQKKMYSTLTRYMDPALAQQMLEQADGDLAGSRQPATCLFADIRDYTSISEKLQPSEVVGMLNEYFGYMVPVVEKHSGVLDKFIGDAMMAVFGVPFPGDNDSERACHAALDMMEALDVYNAKRDEQAQERVRIGIGLNTANVVSGNIGTEKRSDYTVIGDGVNLASRLEGMTKQYRCCILLSESTRDAVAEKFVTRQVDRVRVKGKKKPVKIYELIARKGDDCIATSATLTKCYDCFEEGYALYNQQRWVDAKQKFEDALSHHPTDGPSLTFVDRCTEFLANPPDAESWDGVYVSTAK